MIDLTDKGRLVATDISGSHQSVLDADVTMKEIPRPGLQSVWRSKLKQRLIKEEINGEQEVENQDKGKKGKRRNEK